MRFDLFSLWLYPIFTKLGDHDITIYSSTSLVRGFWDEIFWPSKPRTTKGPRTKEGHIKVDIGTKFLLQQGI